MPLVHNDPEHWRQRAADARALAEKMTDSEYERLALLALERLRCPIA